MRILYVSDIHYSLKQFDWLCGAAAGFDMVVIAGDLLDLGGHADIDTQTVVVSKYLQKLSAIVPVAVCSGNHDLDAQSDHGERIADWLLHLHLDRVTVDHQSVATPDAHFSICSWWDGPESQRSVGEFLAAEAHTMARPWIWIYHAPPDGAKTSWTGKDYIGDKFLSELIRTHKPDLVLGGHIHASPFRREGAWCDRLGNAWVFNPGRQPSAVPSSIVLDLAQNKATWESEMDTVTVDLATQSGG